MNSITHAAPKARQQSLDALSLRLSELITDAPALREQLQCSPQAINQYKKGIARPTLDNLCKIADFYGVSTDYLLGRVDTPNPTPTDFQTALNITGLSAPALQAILDLSENDHKGRKLIGLNLLLTSHSFRSVLRSVAELYEEAKQCGQADKWEDYKEHRSSAEALEYRALKNFMPVLRRIRGSFPRKQFSLPWDDDENN